MKKENDKGKQGRDSIPVIITSYRSRVIFHFWTKEMPHIKGEKQAYEIWEIELGKKLLEEIKGRLKIKYNNNSNTTTSIMATQPHRWNSFFTLENNVCMHIPIAQTHTHWMNIKLTNEICKITPAISLPFYDFARKKKKLYTSAWLTQHTTHNDWKRIWCDSRASGFYA